MDLIPKSKEIGRDSSGIALFMVIAAVSVLAILVTEFTYIAQVSQMIAFGGLDRTKAHYLAKSGLKISLLRLEAYQQVKTFATNLAGPTGGAAVPKSLIQKIWSFPFFYPIPKNIPGMTSTEKGAIEKFEKESAMEGSFSAIIESESSKYSLNMLLPEFAPTPLPMGSPTPNATPAQGSPNTSVPSPIPSFSAAEAQESLYNYSNALWLQKNESDPDFASLNKDVRLPDLVDAIAGWADRTHETRISSGLLKVPMKRAPFYSVTELHMVPLFDDDLYNLYAPNFTSSTTQGININTMQEPILRAILSNNITKEEVVEFFKFRDSEEADNQFKTETDFYNYLTKFVSAFKGNQQNISNLQSELARRRIVLLTDESQFKITVQAKVNAATLTIVAWVTLGTGTNAPNPTASGGPSQPPAGTPINLGSPVNPSSQPTSGIKITYMQIY